MSKNLKLFKRVTCILGITFLVLGIIPLPFVGQVSTVFADKPEGCPAGQIKSGNDCVAVCQWDSGLPFDHPNCKAPEGDDDDDESGCQNDNQCGDGQVCVGGTCQADPGDDDEVTCEYGAWGDCSAPCGGGTQTRDLTSGIPGQCKDTEQACNTQACEDDDEGECLPNGEDCETDADCCEGNCNGNKCKSVVSQCKPLGGPCGGNTDCCPGLTCYIGAGPENEKCVGTACTPTKTEADCPDECGLEASEIDDGCGTMIQCDATPACEDDDECIPTYTQDDCPTACGLQASVLEDECGDVQCAATEACDPGDDDEGDDDDDEGTPGGGGGGTTPAIIPVTGVDFTMPFAAVQQFSMNLGLMLFGVTMVLEGIDRKRTK